MTSHLARERMAAGSRLLTGDFPRSVDRTASRIGNGFLTYNGNYTHLIY